jgi:hypothetical protein
VKRIYDEPNHCAVSTLSYYAVPLDPDIARIYLQKERPSSEPTPEYSYSNRIHRSYYAERDGTQPVIGRIFLKISHPKIPSGINIWGDFRGHSTGKRRA